MSHETTLLVFGVLLVLIGLVGKVKAKELEVGTNSKAARVIIGLLGIALIALSFPIKIPIIHSPKTDPSNNSAIEVQEGDSSDSFSTAGSERLAEIKEEEERQRLERAKLEEDKRLAEIEAEEERQRLERAKLEEDKRLAEIEAEEERQRLTSRCANYARSAVNQQSRNLTKNCGFGLGRWSDSYDAHHEWCLGQPESSAASEEEMRDQRLLECAKRPQKFLDNTNLLWGDIGTALGLSPLDCEKACAENNKCLAWTWVKQDALPMIERPFNMPGCALKNSRDLQRLADPCCVSGIKPK